MPKTFTAQNLRQIEGLSFKVDKQGRVTGLGATVEVNYGGFGRSETLDVFPRLSPTQQAAVQSLYEQISALLTAEFLT